MPGPTRTLVALATALTLALTGCSFGAPDETDQGQPPNLPTPSASPTTPGGSAEDDGVGVQVLVKNLQVPWGLAFLPDGNALVTERDTRRILQVTPGGRSTPVQTIEDAYSGGEGGLLGIAVSPKYATDKTAYIYYTTRTDNRIAKLVLGQPPVPIVTGIPVSGIHNGGRLAFGPDGYLYAGTGDASQRGRAQDVKSLGGKILRMTTAGKPAPGNPYPNSLVWSRGHRNVQGLAWDSQKRLYATEFGQNQWDEVNLITKGGNYGWPTVEGKSTDKRYTNPLVTWSTDEASPSGAAIVGNNLLVAALKGQRIWVVPLDADTGKVKGEPRPLLQDRYGRLRTIMSAPDGSVWVTTSNRDGRGKPSVDDDRILRIIPPGASGVDVL
ncbi:PQQ-dependent sugar dehydrogenase [Cryptosporangium phraense]|uniref:PQQ-dependent sugar dehydrogenase n=1 Tax=Cryptosporangium phraense TaxID=2593070 RepID=A0A545ASK1_9ACTN|nr:PQQ-dependent sugar dehydrogenase [Cryptosporangium phraense]TQS44221.1 PQQ-dependent sugar dehydrogenase [Cryptosporangium phraense]